MKPLFRPYLALLVVCIVWGTTYVGLSIALQTIPPLWLAGLRLTIPGILMSGWSLATGKPLPDWKTLKQVFIEALLIQFSANVLITWSLQFVSSGLVALLCTLIPFFVVLLQLVVFRSESFSRRIILGILISFLGMIVLYADNSLNIQTPNYLLGIGLVMFSNLTWAWGSILSSRETNSLDIFFSAGLQLLLAGILIILLATQLETIDWKATAPIAWWATAYLIVFDSILAFSCYLYALKTLPTTLVAIFAYVNPVIAIALGWLVLKEPFTAKTGLACFIILFGVYLINAGYGERKSSPSSNELSKS